MLHYLIVIPYYFFGALCMLPFLVLVCRLTRLRVEIHTLVGIAIVVSAVAMTLTLSFEHISVRDLGAIPMLILAGTSFILATIDAALSRALPLPLDEQLGAL